MWQHWTQLDNSPLPDQPVIYIGCMTGTSADCFADFTATIFNERGFPLAYRNTQIQITPPSLQANLLSLSTCHEDALPHYDLNSIQHQFSIFLARAYQQVINEFDLASYPKAKIILSPHGQTILHKPKQKMTRQLLDGPLLNQLTGYAVVHSHRQACIQVSNAAPLAPSLIRVLFSNPTTHTVLINGGGIANICVLYADDPKHITAFDTGPANGPIDTLVNYILGNQPTIIPESLRKQVYIKKYDVDGQLAALGKCNQEYYRNLLTHEYFNKNKQDKSADRSMFDLAWLQQALPAHLSLASLDSITTVACLIADTISTAILHNTNHKHQTSAMRIIPYGGLLHNQFIMQRLQQTLNYDKSYQWMTMHELRFAPDYFESLLMAYLGFCVVKQQPIDLSYISQLPAACAIPGVLTGSVEINITL